MSADTAAAAPAAPARRPQLEMIDFPLSVYLAYFGRGNGGQPLMSLPEPQGEGADAVRALLAERLAAARQVHAEFGPQGYIQLGFVMPQDAGALGYLYRMACAAEKFAIDRPPASVHVVPEDPGLGIAHALLHGAAGLALDTAKTLSGYLNRVPHQDRHTQLCARCAAA